MMLPSVVATLLVALALASVQLSTCHLVKGSVSCLDCTRHYHLSGVKLAVKCDHDQRLAFALTDEEGTFQTQLPLSSSSPSSRPPNCWAMILGGPHQLCSSKKALSSKIIKDHHSNSYAISTPLTFSITCPQKDPKLMKSNPNPGIESSKTVDLPLPPEWGLAPSSYYFPFIPIIGIP